MEQDESETGFRGGDTDWGQKASLQSPPQTDGCISGVTVLAAQLSVTGHRHNREDLAGMVVHAFSSLTKKAEAGGSLHLPSQSDPDSEFHVNQNYLVRSCLKEQDKTKRPMNNTNQARHTGLFG